MNSNKNKLGFLSWSKRTLTDHFALQKIKNKNNRLVEIEFCL